MTDIISVLQGTSVIPIVPNATRRHQGLTARGLFVEHHANAPMEFPERELQQHNLFLYTGPAVRAEITSEDFRGTRWMHPGTLWVMPQGSRHGVRFRGRTAGLALAFDPARFAHLVESAGGSHPAQIVETVAACPPRIEHLMRALACESAAPATHDHFGLECVATAIAIAVADHVKSPTVQRPTGPRLAPKQIRAVQSYVEEQLQSTITLADLAAVAGLSSFYFLRAFKRSVGVTPRQYVLDLRIERATFLLKTSNLCIGEIGIRTGFDHAGHFTRAFRRAVGVPPSAFREIAHK